MYDKAAISYEELLDVFWSKHNPTQLNRQGNDTGTQYRCAHVCACHVCAYACM